MPAKMTDRDHFAAAALTGLLCNGDYSMASIPCYAFSMADEMLRERGVTEPMPKENPAEVSVTLTDAEREAISDAADRYAALTPESAETAAILRGLLERFS